jgi:2-oxo-3-(phosphooxy)propyl 3-oxoalkanoate synthase
VTVLNTAADRALTTDRTVSRQLVHRATVAEVFLTDFASLTDGTFRAAAQVPPGHFYYGDHTSRPALHDPLAVFESIRQMLLCAIQLQHGVPGDTKCITAEAELNMTGPIPLSPLGGPLDLLMLGEDSLVKIREDTVSRVVHEVTARTFDGTEVGSARTDTALRAGDAYEKLRMRYRTTPPPTTAMLPATSPKDPVSPHSVGRGNPQNVVIAGTADDGDAVTARLHVPVAHPSMFDHPHDHVPGPVLMEAARQVCLLLAQERLALSPAKLFLQRMRVSYVRFAELDADIAVRASLLPPAPEREPQRLCADVAFVQGGETVTTMEVELGATAGLPAGSLGATNAG